MLLPDARTLATRWNEAEQNRTRQPPPCVRLAFNRFRRYDRYCSNPRAPRRRRCLLSALAESDVNRIPLRVCIAVLAILGWFLSGAIHELGHAVVAKMAGLQVLHMQPWVLLGRVHVRFAGETTDAWHAAIDISGMLLTVLIGITGTIVTCVVGRRGAVIKRAVWLFVPMICQSLAWVALPLILAVGGSAPNDDVTTFIRTTGWNPLTVLAIGLGLVGFCGVVLVWTFKQAAANTRRIERTA